MKIALLGATGRTGRLVLDGAVARGYDVTAVVRDPAKLASVTTTSTRAEKADARDVQALERAFRGADAVVFALGHVGGGDVTVMTDGIRATLEAMRNAGVTRLVAISASGHTTEGDGAFTRALVKPLLGLFLRDAFADMRTMERVIRASGLDWTILRPPMLTDGEARGRYRERRDGNVRGHFRLSRADLADAVLGVLEDPSATHATVSVAG